MFESQFVIKDLDLKKIQLEIPDIQTDNNLMLEIECIVNGKGASKSVELVVVE